MEWAQRLDEAAEVLTDGAPLSFTITAGTSGGGAANGDVPPAVDRPELDLHHARHRSAEEPRKDARLGAAER